MLTKAQIFKTFKDLGLKNNDNIMIHSSLKEIGEIEGRAEGLIEALKEYFNEGLIMLPSHTWSFMNKDNDILDLNEENSCVGILPNIALRLGFLRSHHPTHSIVCFGKYAKEYIKNDDYTSTPVSPEGCFGRLKEINAKILFLGAKLSKNTFIHSIEEKYNVADRFTKKKYHLYSKDNDKLYEYNIYKHYSTLNPHISENYLKLEKPLINLGIAKTFKFGNANSIIIDATLCAKYVSKLLEKNIHIFDDNKEINF
jgi:aminoglycoside 3-N-acetyltransferase